MPTNESRRLGCVHRRRHRDVDSLTRDVLTACRSSICPSDSSLTAAHHRSRRARKPARNSGEDAGADPEGLVGDEGWDVGRVVSLPPEEESEEGLSLITEKKWFFFAWNGVILWILSAKLFCACPRQKKTIEFSAWIDDLVVHPVDPSTALCSFGRDLTYRYHKLDADLRSILYIFSVRYMLLPVGLSSVCLSVCNPRAPYSAGWNFQQYFYSIWYLRHPLTSTKNFTEIVPGNPSVWGRGVKRKRGSQI